MVGENRKHINLSNHNIIASLETLLPLDILE